VHVEVREMPAKMLGPVGADNRAQVINKAHLSDTSPSFSTRRCFSGNWGVSLT